MSAGAMALMLLLLALCLTPSRCFLSVNLTSIRYNYYADMNIASNKIPLIVDTGNAALTVYPRDGKGALDLGGADLMQSNSTCLYLSEDRTYVFYTTKFYLLKEECDLYQGLVRLGPGKAEAKVNFTVADALYIENSALHHWQHSVGDVGLGYPSSPSEDSSFQLILKNVTESLGLGSNIFGLDLLRPASYDDKSFNSSSVQLGAVKSEYSSTMSWQRNANVFDLYHTFFVQNLTICGTNLLSSYASTWPAIVDTGSVCLTLPSELYNTLIAWVDLSGDVVDADELPALLFDMLDDSGNVTSAEVPLSSLLVNASDMSSKETGSPRVIVGGERYDLCVIRGDELAPQGGIFASPRIIVGTLALHSLYFAANFDTHSVGVAPKVAATAGRSSRRRCKAATTCSGDQLYDASSNSCSAPACAGYTFIYVDTETQRCRYNRMVVFFGILIVLLAAAMEVTSYLVLEYSTEELFGSGTPLALGKESAPIVHSSINNSTFPDDGSVADADVLEGGRLAFVPYRAPRAARAAGLVLARATDWLVGRLRWTQLRPGNG